MSDQLIAVPFSPEMITSSMVQGFDCGGEEWEREINDWFKAPFGNGGALDDMIHLGNPVWLFVNDGGVLVGVGSMGPSNASWPKNSSPRYPAICLTWIAVDIRHRGKGYGQQILDNLLSEAVKTADQFPLVVLYVHTANQKALAWYGNSRNNFVPIGKPTIRNERPYQRMAICLRQLPNSTAN